MKKNASQITDEQLLAEFASSGSHAAFTELYRRLSRLVFGVLYRKIRNIDRVEDLVQQTFLNVIAKARTFNGRAKASSWIIAIAINVAAGNARNFIAKRQVQAPCEAMLWLHADKRKTPYIEAVEREERGNLFNALQNKLPAYHADVVRLLDIEGVNYDDAAVALGIPVGTVRSRRHRALQLLRELMN